MQLSEAVAIGGYFHLVPLVVFFPIIGLVLNILLGRRLSEKGVGAIASLASGASFLVGVLQAISLTGNPEGVTVPFLEWIKIGALEIPWSFRVDTLSVTMMLVVAGVGTLIHIYAIGYMHEDVRINGDPGRYPRFFVYLNLFIAAMMVLVSASNYLMLFVGWEGVGLCSYLLIGFWFDKGKDGIGNALAAKKAFVVNRIGDFGFLIAALLLFWTFGSFDFQHIFSLVPQFAEAKPGILLAITLFMLLGVTGKSAQIPLFVWLPDAMAGPTPVSALIHAATMVTAGVYLVARSHPLYGAVPLAQNTVALVGGLTALLAATIAVGQFDIKKVLAYSTISQLGFMVAAVGMGAFTAGMFHLVTHAFFKALLFLSAGSVIQGVEHGLHALEHSSAQKENAEQPSTDSPEHTFDPQDMRNMGGLRQRMSITFWVYLIGAVALAGIPPLAGFWSKDEILAEATQLNPLVYILLTVAAFFTAFYMGRQVLMVFFGKARSEPAAHAQENPPLMTVPLMILGVLSLVGGFLNFPSLDTLSGWLEQTIHPIEASGSVLAGFNPLVAIISTLLAVTGIAIAWYLYRVLVSRQPGIPLGKRQDDPLRALLGPVFTGMEHKWWVDEIYHALVVNPYVAASRFLAEVVDGRFWHDWFHDILIAGGYRLISQVLSEPIDLGIIDWIANGLADITKGASASLRRIQTGFVSNYALAIFLGVVAIIGYLLLR